MDDVDVFAGVVAVLWLRPDRMVRCAGENRSIDTSWRDQSLYPGRMADRVGRRSAAVRGCFSWIIKNELSALFYPDGPRLSRSERGVDDGYLALEFWAFPPFSTPSGDRNRNLNSAAAIW